MSSPTVLSDRLIGLAYGLLVKEASVTAFRPIGIGANPLIPGTMTDPADPSSPGQGPLAAIEALRGRFGNAAIIRGHPLD
ncbi:MAG: hypothetical protein ACJ8AW_51750 [Rhodopila sp.]|jgi:hypothetical protein